jgi:ATP synthase protein I
VNEGEPSEAPPEAKAKPSKDHRGREMSVAIAQAERLEAKARSQRGRNLWVQVSRVGTLGWLLALPIVGGALIGHLIDRKLGTGLTFALGLLGVGLAMAGYALWRHADELPQD